MELHLSKDDNNVSLLVSFLFSGKHLGKLNLIHIACSKTSVAVTAVAGCMFAMAPGVAALIAAFLRRTPIMLPYHIFGDRYRLIEMETEGSLDYLTVVLFEWVILSGAASAWYSLVAICGDATVVIVLICKALR